MDFTAKELQLLFQAISDMADMLGDDVSNSALSPAEHNKAVDNSHACNRLLKKVRSAMESAGVSPDEDIYADPISDEDGNFIFRNF